MAAAKAVRFRQCAPQSDLDPHGASPSEPTNDALPLTIELRLPGVVLDESSLARSPMLPYVRMIVGLIEGVEFTCDEVAHLLRQAMRQHSFGARRRIDYILGFSGPASAVASVR